MAVVSDELNDVAGFNADQSEQRGRGVVGPGRRWPSEVSVEASAAGCLADMVNTPGSDRSSASSRINGCVLVS